MTWLIRLHVVVTANDDGSQAATVSPTSIVDGNAARIRND
jgi:hypothetical protein